MLGAVAGSTEVLGAVAGSAAVLGAVVGRAEVLEAVAGSFEVLEAVVFFAAGVAVCVAAGVVERSDASAGVAMTSLALRHRSYRPPRLVTWTCVWVWA